MSEEEYTEEVEQVESVTEEATDSEADLDTPEGEEAAPSEEPEGAEEKPKKSKGGFQRRIDELTKARYEAEQEKERIRQELEQLRQQHVQTEHEGQKPRLEDYNYDHEAWSQAYEQWMQDGWRRQQEAQQQAQQQAQAQQQQMQRQMDLQQKVLKAQDKYPDFQQKVFDPSLPNLGQLNQAAYEAVISSEYMADVAYHLADNPAEVYKFGQMSPIEAVKEIARLESKFSNKPHSKSNAPKPPSTVEANNANVPTLKNAKSAEEWIALRNKQLYGG